MVPVFLFAPTSVPHRLLVGYKAAPSAASRAHHSSALGDVLSLFLARHQACVARDAAPVTLVPVPSSSGGRASWHGRHPLVALCEKAAEASGTSVRSCLAPGAAGTRRLGASPDGFRVVSRPSTATVVVVDDMFTSGARALSATAALEGAGLRVAAVVPLGRLVCPGHNRETAAFWREVGSRPWSPLSCCACRPRPLALEVAPSAWLEAARAA